MIDNHLLSEDGVGGTNRHYVLSNKAAGREGSFSMCTFWLVEALARAGK